MNARHTEETRVACSCRAERPNKWTIVYRLDADPNCERCHGIGWWGRRTVYDRDPNGGFAKILHEERFQLSDPLPPNHGWWTCPQCAQSVEHGTRHECDRTLRLATGIAGPPHKP